MKLFQSTISFLDLPELLPVQVVLQNLPLAKHSGNGAWESAPGDGMRRIIYHAEDLP